MQILPFHCEVQRHVNKKKKQSNNWGTEHHTLGLSDSDSHSAGICTGISTVGSESKKLVCESSKPGFAFGFYFEACKLQLFYSWQDVFLWNKTSPAVQITLLQGFFMLQYHHVPLLRYVEKKILRPMYIYIYMFFFLKKKGWEKPSTMEKGGEMEGVGNKNRTQKNTFSKDCSRQKGHVMLNSSQ